MEYKGEPVEINFNPNFVKEVLQNINEDFTIFEFTNSFCKIFPNFYLQI
ncbi:MAG: hypothetical protein LBS81_03525 [Endomicrobium sp.]|nr:hypothetical protein [Endomicrobium sp.]